MRKLIILIFLIFIYTIGKSQPLPNKVLIGSTTTEGGQKGIGINNGGTILADTIYVDTTAANLRPISYYNQAVIITGTTGNYTMWFRTLAPPVWTKLATGSIPSTFNPLQGFGLLLTGTYPNITFTVDTTLIPAYTDTLKTYGLLTRAKGDALYSKLGSGVTSATGTSNQIIVSPTTGNVIISLPTNVIVSGILSASGLISTGNITTTTVTASGAITGTYFGGNALSATNATMWNGQMFANNLPGAIKYAMVYDTATIPFTWRSADLASMKNWLGYVPISDSNTYIKNQTGHALFNQTAKFRINDTAWAKRIISDSAVLAPNITYVTPEQFGADSTGISDSKTAWQNAIYSGKPIFANGKYLISDSLKAVSNMIVFGHWFMQINGDYAAFNVSSLDSNVTITGGTIRGTGRGSGTDYVTIRPNQKGINVPGDPSFGSLSGKGHVFGNMKGVYLGGSTIYVAYNSFLSTPSGLIYNVSSDSCYIGINVDIRGEYWTIQNVSSVECEYGISARAGNNILLNPKSLNDRTSAYFTGGSNYGHFNIVNPTWNHAKDKSANFDNTGVASDNVVQINGGVVSSSVNGFYIGANSWFVTINNLMFVEEPSINVTSGNVGIVFNSPIFDSVTTFSTSGADVKYTNINWVGRTPYAGLVNTLTVSDNAIQSGNFTSTGTLASETIPTGVAGSDSVSVIKNGVIKKISPTYYATSGSGVTTIIGTNNQITASASTGPVTLSIPSALIVSSSISSTTLIGTLSTAAQTNITSLGTLSGVSISGFAGYISNTHATQSQFSFADKKYVDSLTTISGTEFWQRNSTTLSPVTIGDNINTSGTLRASVPTFTDVTAGSSTADSIAMLSNAVLKKVSANSYIQNGTSVQSSASYSTQYSTAFNTGSSNFGGLTNLTISSGSGTQTNQFGNVGNWSQFGFTNASTVTTSQLSFFSAIHGDAYKRGSGNFVGTLSGVSSRILMNGSATTDTGFSFRAMNPAIEPGGSWSGTLSIGGGLLIDPIRGVTQLPNGGGRFPIVRSILASGTSDTAEIKGTLLIGTNANITGSVTTSGVTVTGNSNAFIDIKPTSNTGFGGINIYGGASIRAGIKLDVNLGEVSIGALGGGGYYPVFYANGTPVLSFTTSGVATFANLGIGAVYSSGGTLSNTAPAGTGNVRGSFSATGTATTTFTVTIGQTMLNTNYYAAISPNEVLTAAAWYINNYTTTTFDVVFLTGLTGSVTFKWLVVP